MPARSAIRRPCGTPLVLLLRLLLVATAFLPGVHAPAQEAPVAGETPEKQVGAILERVVAEHPLVLKDPAPVIKLNELADSSVNFVVRPWVKGGDYWQVHWDLLAAVKKAFDREGVTIPFPQHDVHVHQASR